MAFDAHALARRWLDDESARGAIDACQTGPRIEVAWALKEICNETWNTDPPRARLCAERLRSMANEDPTLRALSAWASGLEQLTLGRMEDALGCLDEAHTLLVALGLEHQAAKCDLPRVIALAMLGRHDEALRCAERARLQFIAVNDEASAAKVELNLGSMLLRQDRYDEAATLYRQAAVRFAHLCDAKHSIMADIGLATALTWQFEFDEAMRIYDRAEMRVRTHGLPMLQAVIDLNRGRLELHRGRHGPALRALHAALAGVEQANTPQAITEVQRNLGDAYLALNLLPEAVALYERAIAACRDVDAPVERAWAHVQRARALAQLDDRGAALRDLAEARKLFETQRNVVGVALVDLHGAALSLRSGDAHDALTQAERAARAFAHAGIDGWQFEAQVLAATALADAGRPDVARRRYRQTLREAHGLPEVEASCHIGLGLLNRQRGRLHDAREHFEAAIGHLEAQRAALPGDEFRTAYAADRRTPYDALIELAMVDDDPEAPARTLACMERARSRALRLGMERGDSADVEGPQRERLRWLQQQWQQALSSAQTQRAHELQQRARALEAEWLERRRRAQAATADAAAAAPSDRPFRAEALQAALPQGTALVEYALIGQRLAAVVATRDALYRVTADGSGIDDRIQQLRFQIDSLRFGAAALRAHVAQMTARTQAHLQALHTQVWQPLARHVADCERVIVVPHRSLHYLPFCALHDGTQALIDRHEISVAPSAALWLRGQGDPEPQLAAAVVLGVGSDTLQHVGAEVRSVADAFDSAPGGSATVLLDASATHAALRAALPGADVLHLACHGQFRADSPYFSSLHLADGPLTLHDAAALPLHASLVTLSACETGLSRVAPGDELLGLLRGFLLAGAPRVLATQWTVDDASTATLMGEFYRRLLRRRESPAAALRGAQRALRAELPHPGHWAAFTLHTRR